MINAKPSFLIYLVLVFLVSSCSNDLIENSSSIITNTKPKNKNSRTHSSTVTKKNIGGIVPIELDNLMSEVSLSDFKLMLNESFPEAYEILEEIMAEILNSGKLKHAKDFAWNIKIIDYDSENAYCLPGGKIYVHKGLFLNLHSSEELAGVIAHEIMHVENRDYLKSIIPFFLLEHLDSFIKGTVYTSLVLNKLKWLILPSTLYGIIHYLNTVHRQIIEKQADLNGLELLKDTKYSADAVSNWFREVAEKNDSKTNKMLSFMESNFFSDHPSDIKRARYIDKYVRENKFKNFGTSVDKDERFEKVKNSFLKYDKEKESEEVYCADGLSSFNPAELNDKLDRILEILNGIERSID